MSKKRKIYSIEFKTKVIIELLREENTAAAIVSRYGLRVQTLNQRKIKLLENASLEFDIGKTTKDYRDKIQKLEKENETLAKTLLSIPSEEDIRASKATNTKSIFSMPWKSCTQIREDLHQKMLKSKKLKAGIKDFISFYNIQRFHSSLDYHKPMIDECLLGSLGKIGLEVIEGSCRKKLS